MMKQDTSTLLEDLAVGHGTLCLFWQNVENKAKTRRGPEAEDLQVACLDFLLIEPLCQC